VLLRALIGFLLLAIVFMPLERLWPAHSGARWFRPGFRTDVLHFFFTGLLTTAGLVLAAIPIVVAMNALTPAAIRDAVTAQPELLQFLEALLIVELVGYWSHRMMHTVPALWRLHRVHHSSERMDWLAAAHLHPFDGSLGRLLAVIPLAYLGYSRATFGGALVLLQLHAIFQHANLRVRFGPLRSVISSPQFHHWHHTNDAQARDRNFAGLFPWIDVLFGTFHLPDRAWPATYGVDDPIPAGYLRQLASPFRGVSTAGALRAPLPVPLGTCAAPSSTIPTSSSSRSST
jgi:sterol desaturase/sphingolipid hydroxylase (fatty acid hydroxylase superfamily)